MCLTNWLPFLRDGPPNGYLELLSPHDLIFGVIGKKWCLVMRGESGRGRETDHESRLWRWGWDVLEALFSEHLELGVKKWELEERIWQCQSVLALLLDLLKFTSTVPEGE